MANQKWDFWRKVYIVCGTMIHGLWSWSQAQVGFNYAWLEKDFCISFIYQRLFAQTKTEFNHFSVHLSKVCLLYFRSSKAWNLFYYMEKETLQFLTNQKFKYKYFKTLNKKFETLNGIFHFWILKVSGFKSILKLCSSS